MRAAVVVTAEVVVVPVVVPVEAGRVWVGEACAGEAPITRTWPVEP